MFRHRGPQHHVGIRRGLGAVSRTGPSPGDFQARPKGGEQVQRRVGALSRSPPREFSSVGAVASEACTHGTVKTCSYKTPMKLIKQPFSGSPQNDLAGFGMLLREPIITVVLSQGPVEFPENGY